MQEGKLIGCQASDLLFIQYLCLFIELYLNALVFSTIMRKNNIFVNSYLLSSSNFIFVIKTKHLSELNLKLYKKMHIEILDQTLS